MQNFDELLEVAAILNGPEGCAWDRKQTFQSLQQYVLEEAHEVLEAVDHNDDDKIIEELGDLLYTIVFYAKVAQRTGRFSMEDIIDSVKQKLIRRHPHVFGDLKIETEEELEKNWDKIKSQEKGKDKRTHALEGIPASLPLIARAQKVLKIMMKESVPFYKDRLLTPIDETEFADQMLHLIWLAEGSKLDAESAFRRYLLDVEKRC
ncbi:MAG: MazG family protein [Chlamydiae bacterium]|nr:MazG family protein [Chlamydiota bacterium]